MVLLQLFRINVAFPLLDFFLVPSSFCFFSFSCQHFQGRSKNEQEGFQVSKCIEYLILTRNMYSLAMSMRLLKALAGRKWVQHVWTDIPQIQSLHLQALQRLATRDHMLQHFFLWRRKYGFPEFTKKLPLVNPAFGGQQFLDSPITLHLRNWWGLQRSWKVFNIWRQLRTGQTGQNFCHGCGPCHSIRAMGLVDRATGQGQDTKSDWDHISLLHSLHDTLGWGSFGHQETIIAVSCSHPKVLIQFMQELAACARAWYGLRGRFEILEECVPSFASFFSYEPQVNKHQFCHHMLVVCNEVDHTNHYLQLPKVWGFETKGFFTLIISVIWACQKYAQQEQSLWITFKLLAKQRTNMCTVYSLYVNIHIYICVCVNTMFVRYDWYVQVAI